MNELTVQDIQTKIIHLPNRPPAMLASEVANIYGVKTRYVNRAVKRNPKRFPDDFCFRLTDSEIDFMVCQNGIPQISDLGGHRPWMFTRYGANQLSGVLKSDMAAQRSVQIMRAFSAVEEIVEQQAGQNDIGGAFDLLFGEKGFFSFEDLPKLPQETRHVIQAEVKNARNEGANAALKLIRALSNSKFPDNFIDKLIIYRQRGNSQAETAKLLDVGDTTIRRYEKLAVQAGMIEKDSRGKVIQA